MGYKNYKRLIYHQKILYTVAWITLIMWVVNTYKYVIFVSFLLLVYLYFILSASKAIKSIVLDPFIKERFFRSLKSTNLITFYVEV